MNTPEKSKSVCCGAEKLQKNDKLGHDFWYVCSKCGNPFIPSPASKEEKYKCESCLAGFSREDIAGNCTCSPTKETGEDWDLKKWFEANYLDGDKIQDGQMLSSEECFDAVKSILTQKCNEIRGKIEEYKLPKTVGNMAGDYIFVYDLETFILKIMEK